MVGRIHNCEKCDGFLALFYDGWNCSRCGRKYFIQGNQFSEMWWRKQSITDQEAEDVAIAVG